MSDLSASLTDFRKRLQASGTTPKPSVTVKRESPRPVKRPESPAKEKSPSKKPRMDLKQAVMQAAQNNLSALHLATNLHLAVDVVKKHGKPMTLDELRKELRMPDISRLLPTLKSTEKIKYDLDRNTFEYVSILGILSAPALLEYLSQQTVYQGVSVSDLKDGWPGCNPTLNDLERKNKILILRAKKDNAPRRVWLNTRELALGAIDTEFVDMWQKVKLPSASELPVKLNERGIKPTSVDPSLLKKPGAVKVQKKARKKRKGKITNTHMRGVLRDYA